MRHRSTTLIGLIGQGVAPSLSPAMHEREGRRHGMHYIYRTIDITPDEVHPAQVRSLLHAARRFRFDGLNITHPLKQEVVPLLDELAASARQVGAVNTVVFEGERMVGHNTDVTGFGSAFDAAFGRGPFGRVVVVGAGGAGAAVACALAARQVAEVSVVDVVHERATDLARQVWAGPAGDGPPRAVRAYPCDELPGLLAQADGVVNATPMGMADHPGLPFDVELLTEHLWVSDVVYRPTHTELLRAAGARGCVTMSGLGMAMGQAADAFEIFTGERADRARMLADLQELVAADAADKPA